MVIRTHGLNLLLNSRVTQIVENLPETQVQFLDRKTPWRREGQPTSAFLPGEFHGQRTLENYRPWGHKKLDMTE